MTLPELSVDGFHASVTLVCVRPVTRRFVGVVGGVRSLAVRPATEPMTTSASVRTNPALAVRRNAACFPLMSILPFDDAPVGTAGLREIGGGRAIGLQMSAADSSQSGFRIARYGARRTSLEPGTEESV